MTVERVVLCEPRGFCAGVEMAVNALTCMVRLFGAPVYCYHEIVHNRAIVESFERAGVVFVDDVVDVPPGAPLMLSAHGSGPGVRAAAGAAGGVVVDASCPLVTKVHHEVKRRAGAGYEIVYVGHQGHDEAVGTLAEAPGTVHLVETPADVDALDLTPGVPVAFAAQTTLAVHESQDVEAAARGRFPGLRTPATSDLCFATTNRQAAVAAVAGDVDVLVVVGSANSSNTRALVRVGESRGAGRVFRVEGPEDVTAEMLAGARTVGLTSGASVDDAQVQGVLALLRPAEVLTVRAADEDEYFPLPRELRALLAALGTVVAWLLGVPQADAASRGRSRGTRITPGDASVGLARLAGATAA